MTERYRLEHGMHCVDVRLTSVEQLFDNRDPAPFRERDLDPDLVEYLTAAGEDLIGDAGIRIVFWIEKPCAASEIEGAFRAHFAYELERIDRRRKRARRVGEISLAVGVALLVLLLSLAQLAGRTVPGSFGATLQEGLTLLSWIVMWRPVETLLYDWLPVRRERRVMQHIAHAAVELRTGR